MTKEKKITTGDAMEQANQSLQVELQSQASSIVKEVQALLAGKSGLESKVVFYYVAKKYFTDRKTGQPFNPKDWLLDVLAYGSLINRLELNPLTGDVAVVHFWNNMTHRFEPTFITTIQAMRKIAHRTGRFGGADAPVIIEDEEGNIIKAKATVYIVNEKDGKRMPVEGEAYWAEFAKSGKGDSFWSKMPRHMLGKCAQAQAFRNAFSEEFASLYTAEELKQDEPETVLLPSLDEKSEEKKQALLDKFEEGNGDTIAPSANSKATDSSLKPEKVSDTAPEKKIAPGANKRQYFKKI